MAARSVSANISNKLNIIAHNLKRAPKPDKIIFDTRKRPGFYSEGIASRLPAAYFKWRAKPGVQPPAIYSTDPNAGDWMKHSETGERIRTKKSQIKVTYLRESQLGLWSGEGIIEGYRKTHKTSGIRLKKVWKPFLQKKEFYSEILDKTFTITVSLRTLDLIDEAYGFDFYILKTPPEVLNSMMGMALKRNLLLRLAQKDKVYPDDPDKRDKIYRRYGQYVIPKEEAEWVGLTRSQAIAKQRLIEEQQNPDRPLQEVYTEQLIAELRDKEMKGATLDDDLDNKSRPLLSRLFGSKGKEEESTT
ncbi:large ribosomal subunit protein bL28m-like isoform X1 [Asterias amurensis]|uniref:large ribosomal subunit protein bL28m-like isoform X1 n=1 Tax=Asterias amurensis TaxID=7602 RepID=UPI003AB683A2